MGELSNRVDRLKEQLGVNSSNLSRPPSQDSLEQRAKRKKKPPSDRHGGYNDHSPDQRPLCWTHIIRNLARIAEHKGLVGRLGQRLVRWARLTVRIEHRWRSSPYTSDVYQQRLAHIRHHFHTEPETGLTHQVKTRTGNQCQRLLRDETMRWTCLSHPDIPLTNNATERALRPNVIWRKTSYRLWKPANGLV